jgi:hypothetical protein
VRCSDGYHLSFQEYLSAWFLHTTVEGDAGRIATLQRFSDFEGWWETLRLWISLVNGQQPSKLSSILDGLFGNSGALSLAGAIFADGSGLDESFQRWFKLYTDQIKRPWSRQVSDTAKAWTDSRQQGRKESMVNTIREIAASQSWREWTLLRCWARNLGVDAFIDFPAPGTLGRLLIEAQYGTGLSRQHLAVGRILSSGVPVWEVGSWESMLLCVWPSRRRLTGQVLQALAVLGFDREELIEFVRRESELTSRLPAKIGVADLDSDSTFDITGFRITRDAARALKLNFAIEWELQKTLAERLSGATSPEGFMYEWSRHMQGDSSGDWFDRRWGKEAANAYVTNPRQFSGAADGLLLDTQKRIELFPQLLLSPMGLLAYLAYVEPEQRIQPLNLIRCAARIALGLEPKAHALKRELAFFSSTEDPLWPSLAKHLAFRSSNSDLEILIGAAGNPNTRSGVFAWSLQHIVRGDIILNDGSELMLNEITSRLALPNLPLIENYPVSDYVPTTLLYDWQLRRYRMVKLSVREL